VNSHPGITSGQFLSILKREGFDFFVGVPCSLIDRLTQEMAHDPDVSYVPAVREDSAVGIAAGAYLAGRRPLVFMQNSALGVCMNALASLAIPYRLPILLLITWRGHAGNDSEEHGVMGAVTLDMIDHLRLRRFVLEAEGVERTVLEAVHALREGQVPVALVVRRGILR
jgi:phosphonopyruvate decarboxylase